MPYELLHDPDKAQADRDKEYERITQENRARIKQLEMEEMAASIEPPKKEEVTPTPPGPPESWPVALLPDGEDICGNGHVLKKQLKPGIAELGKPPSRARVKMSFTAHDDVREGKVWDSSESLGIRLGDLYTSRVLEAAAASLDWGEKATFVCTALYAKGNNASRRALPQGVACVRYEVELLSWRAPQLRDRKQSMYDHTNEERLEEVVALKAQAAPLVKLGLISEAREIYQDATHYLENRDKRDDGSCFLPPEGREDEAKALLLSLYLNDAMCTLRLGEEFRRAEDLCTRAIELDATSVKALYRRGVARMRLHEHTDAHADLYAAARLDPNSREGREAIAELKTLSAAARSKDAKFAGKSLGSKAGAIPRAPPGGGLKQPATVWMELAIGGESIGRVVMQMYEGAPLTTENFRCLCTGERGIGNSGSRLHYKGSGFHRLIPGFVLQGGDIVKGDGFGGDSIYGGTFKDERFLRKHDRKGLLSMANVGPHTNASQFFVTLCEAPHLDGTSVIFGEITEGFDLIARIENEVAVDEDDKPTVPITIADCGEIVNAPPPQPLRSRIDDPALAARNAAAAGKVSAEEGKAEEGKAGEAAEVAGEARATASEEARTAKEDAMLGGVNIAAAVASLAKGGTAELA